jgi:hypothetical protein
MPLPVVGAVAIRCLLGAEGGGKWTREVGEGRAGDGAGRGRDYSRLVWFGLV